MNKGSEISEQPCGLSLKNTKIIMYFLEIEYGNDYPLIINGGPRRGKTLGSKVGSCRKMARRKMSLMYVTLKAGVI